jgi:rhodanese-related sulfurtransferase
MIESNITPTKRKVQDRFPIRPKHSIFDTETFTTERHTMQRIFCDSLRLILDKEQEYALLDIREPGEYNLGHIPGTTLLPRRDIEFRIRYLIPVRNTRIILVGDGGKRELLAAAMLEADGYGKVEILAGGFPGWSKAGYAMETGVNVPSKEFGERVRLEFNVPEIEPADLRSRIDRGEPFFIFDARTPEEYARFCIPGGLNVPGGDLILRAEELKNTADILVVINCAGRTRSIIGAQSLRRLGLTNVFALRNGIMGWFLGGFDLEREPKRNLTPPSEQSVSVAEKLAARVAEEEQIPLVSVSEVGDLLSRREGKTVYAMDVRSCEEYSRGHIPDFISVPGGQAVQRADDYVAVRTAAIVFSCDHSARATMAAYWYRKMGFKNVLVLRGGIDAWVKHGRTLECGDAQESIIGLERACSSVRCISSSYAESLRTDKPDLLIVDVGLSRQYSEGHLPGAVWLSRDWIEERIAAFYPERRQPILVTCPDGRQSALAGATLVEMGYSNVSVLEGGMQKWIEHGRPVETELTKPLMEPNDVVLSASMSGDTRAMRRYLEWEIELARKTEKK